LGLADAYTLEMEPFFAGIALDHALILIGCLAETVIVFCIVFKSILVFVPDESQGLAIIGFEPIYVGVDSFTQSKNVFRHFFVFFNDLDDIFNY